MLLTDRDGVVFEISADKIDELKTRHGKGCDYTQVVTFDNHFFYVTESVPYIMKLINNEKGRKSDEYKG